MKGYVIRTDGSTEIVEFDNNTSYEVLSNSVGGYIECVSLDNGLDMWVNEEGKLLNLPVNEIATYCWESVYGPTDVIHGNVIFTGGVDRDGEILGLKDHEISRLNTLSAILNRSFSQGVS